MIVWVVVAVLALGPIERALRRWLDRSRATQAEKPGYDGVIVLPPATQPLGRALFDQEAGETAYVEIGDGTTLGPLELQLDEIRNLPEAVQ